MGLEPHETFRRVRTIHESRGQLADRLSRRNSETGSRIQKTSRRESAQTRAETWEQKKKAGSGQAAFRFRPRGSRNLEYRLRFFVLLRRQFRIRQTLADNLSAETAHSLTIVNRLFLRSAIVESENLFVNVPLQVERLNCYIRSLESALEKRPKILDSR